MAMIEWDERYSVGVSELDEQHKKLFKLIDTLLEVGDTESSLQVLADVLEEMRAYASYHFETEERYMTECAYSDLKNHVSQHEDFCEKVNEMASNMSGPKHMLLEDMTSYLYNWLVDHILVSDKKYAPYLSSRPVEAYKTDIAGT